MSKNSYKYVISSIVVLSLIYSRLCFSSGALTYDKAWWSRTGQDERTEFIAGFIDCAVSNKGDTGLINTSWYVVMLKINKFYLTNPKSSSKVSSLIYRFRQKKVNSTDISETYPNSIFDGLYWKQLLLKTRGQEGFIEGYLACIDTYVQKSTHRRHDAHSVIFYVKKISKYYNLTLNGDIDGERESTQISYILNKLTHTHYKNNESPVWVEKKN